MSGSEIARYVNREVGIVITVTEDTDGVVWLRYVERGTTHTARGGQFAVADLDHVLSLASSYAAAVNATKIMVSPLAEAHRGPSASLTPAGAEALAYAVRWGYVARGSGISERTLKLLKDQGYVALDMDVTVRFRIVGAWPTELGHRAMERQVVAA